MSVTTVPARAQPGSRIRVTKRKRSRQRRREVIAGYGFVSPLILGMLLWTLIPMGASLYFSFTAYNLPAPPKWVGTANYTALFQNPAFYNSLKVTFLYAVIEVPLSLFVGLMIAVLLNQGIPGMRLFRTLIYLPAVIPIVGATVIFKDMLSPSKYGLFNSMLESAGIIHSPIQFFTSPSTALASVIFMGLWGSGGSMLIWLAGLQSVPNELYEATRVDGAGAWTRFWRVTIPMISPTILFNSVLAIILAMQIFVQSLILNSGDTGAPLGSLDFLSVFTYRYAFGYLNMGYASAVAWILFVIILILTLAFFRASRKRVFYAGG